MSDFSTSQTSVHNRRTDERTRAIVDRVAQAAAHQAVTEMMKTLGVDTKDPDSMRRWYAQQAFVVSLMKGSEDSVKVIRRTAITILMGAGATIVALGFRAWMAQQNGGTP